MKIWVVDLCFYRHFTTIILEVLMIDKQILEINVGASLLCYCYNAYDVLWYLKVHVHKNIWWAGANNKLYMHIQESLRNITCS